MAIGSGTKLPPVTTISTSACAGEPAAAERAAGEAKLQQVAAGDCVMIFSFRFLGGGAFACTLSHVSSRGRTSPGLPGRRPSHRGRSAPPRAAPPTPAPVRAGCRSAATTSGVPTTLPLASILNCSCAVIPASAAPGGTLRQPLICATSPSIWLWLSVADLPVVLPSVGCRPPGRRAARFLGVDQVGDLVGLLGLLLSALVLAWSVCFFGVSSFSALGLGVSFRTGGVLARRLLQLRRTQRRHRRRPAPPVRRSRSSVGDLRLRRRASSGAGAGSGAATGCGSGVGSVTGSGSGLTGCGVGRPARARC